MISYIITLLSLPLLVAALIEEDVMPTMLQECYMNSAQTGPQPSQYHVQTNCLETYLSHLYRNSSFHSLDQEAMDWIDSLGRKIHLRLKRQAGLASRLRVRKEIRALTEDERGRLFDAINKLKKDTSVRPNKYDAIALIHNGNAAIVAAHDGPAFVGWHRYYVYLFEEALRTKQRRVTVPYWDTTCDFLMKDPTNTIMLSELFIGNGQGVVFTGPFALWTTPANTYIWRDIPGPRSSLIDPTKIKNVFNKKFHRQILTPTSRVDEDNLERHHDGVHRWIGGRNGHMGDPFLAPQDPVFWFHHSFIDYLWEKFREGQKRKGVNSEKDYPETTIASQMPNVNMYGLSPPKTNIYGYSNDFTTKMYRYADAPTCKNKCGGARRGYLYCDRSKNACVSRSRSEYMRIGDYRNAKYWNTRRGDSGTIASVPSISPTPRTVESGFAFSAQTEPAFAAEPTPLSTQKFRESIVDPRTTTIRKRSADKILSRNKNMEVGVEMNFNLKTGESAQLSRPLIYNPSDFNDWILSPIEIINRHYGNSRYDLQSLQSQTSTETFQMHPFQIAKPPTFNVTIQTDGFSYIGRRTGNVIVDKKTRLSESLVYAVLKKPILGESKAYVSVYDSFGGVCQPHCLTAKQTYLECSGVVKVTPDYPLMYFDTSGLDFGAELKPFLRFICEN